MCCKGSEIKYKDYTPYDQMGSRQQYNRQAQAGMRAGATPYGQNAPFMAQMNPLQAMAMQSMFQQGGGQGQMQLPQYLTQGQFAGGMPMGGQMPQMGGMQGGGGMGMPQQGMMGGNQPGQFQGMRGMMGGQQGMGQPQGQFPYWLMMPGMGGGQQGGAPPVQ